MLESKVRSEGLWVNDSRPTTFPSSLSCGLAVSDVTVTVSISHGGAAWASPCFPAPPPAVS